MALRLLLLVVIDGTPDLQTHLKEVRIGFPQRCTRLRIGCLETAEAAGEALTKPTRDFRDADRR